jgi:hypothetical protein
MVLKEYNFSFFRLISMSENPELRENSENDPPVQFESKEVNDCLTNWLAFLKVNEFMYFYFYTNYYAIKLKS